MLPRPSTGTLFPYTTLFRSSPPLNNLKVRQALSLATNAKQLNEVVLKDAYFNAVSIVAPGVPGQKKENALGYDSRSEERRVGKERREQWGPDGKKKKKE